MPKINKKTIVTFPRIPSLKIYQFTNSTNYFCNFYVGTHILKSGNKEMTLNEFGEVTNFKDEQGKNLNLEEIIETDFLYDGPHTNLITVGWEIKNSDLLLKAPFKLKNKN